LHDLAANPRILEVPPDNDRATFWGGRADIKASMAFQQIRYFAVQTRLSLNLAASS
jgi:hypothetical protein